MARQIPVLRVLAEGAVIVISILMALAADAWWDGRQDREEENALLRSLHAEISLNLTELDEWEDLRRGTNHHSAELLRLSSPDAPPIDAFHFDSLFAGAVSFRTYHPSTGSINAVLARLSLVGSEALRLEVAGFEERLRDLQENFEWYADEVENLLSHVQARLPIFTLDNRAWTEADPGSDRHLILRDVEFANLVGLAVWRQGHMGAEAADFRAYLNRMLELLEAAEDQ